MSQEFHYNVVVTHTPENLAKVNEAMGKILEDWGHDGKRLVVLQTVPIISDHPLTEEERRLLMTVKPAGAVSIEVEEVAPAG